MPRIARRAASGNASDVSDTSDHAELSTLRSQLEELNQRVTTVAERYGDWRRGPLTPAGPEIITVARAAS